MMKSHLNKLLFIISLCIAATNADAQDRKKAQELYIKAQTQFNSARYEKAVELYTLAIQADSSHYNSWIRRGFTKGILKDFEGELADYTKVIEKDPNHIWAYISRGSAKNKRSDFHSAIEDFNKALEIDPREQEAFNNRGFAKKGLGDMEGACDDWMQSRKMGNEEAKIILKNNHCK